MRNLFKSLVIFLFSLLSLNSYAEFTVPQKPVPADFVKDYANIIDPAMAQMMRDSLEAFMRKSSAQIQVVTVDDLGGEDIGMVATNIINAWGIGSKEHSNGVIVLVKPKRGESDRGQAFIGTGYGMEGVIPDILCARICDDEMIPHFKENDYGAGIWQAVQTIEAYCLNQFTEQDYYDSHGGTGDDSDLDAWGFVAIILMLFLLPLLVMLTGASFFVVAVAVPVKYLWRITIGNLIAASRRRSLYENNPPVLNGDLPAEINLLTAFRVYEKYRSHSPFEFETMRYRRLIEGLLLHMEQRNIISFKGSRDADGNLRMDRLHIGNFDQGWGNVAQQQEGMERRLYSLLVLMANDEYVIDANRIDAFMKVGDYRRKVYEFQKSLKWMLSDISFSDDEARTIMNLHAFFQQTHGGDDAAAMVQDADGGALKTDVDNWDEYMLYAHVFDDDEQLYNGFSSTGVDLPKAHVHWADNIPIVTHLLKKMTESVYRVRIMNFYSTIFSIFIEMILNGGGRGGSSSGGGGGRSYGGGSSGGGGGGSSW